MRLYSKLLLLILTFGAIQQFAAPSVGGGVTWFEIRCLAADLLHDEELIEQLADEHYRSHRTSDDVEIELRLAAR